MSMKINHELPLPEVLKSQYPLSQELKEVKKQRDEEIRRIFTGESDKFIVLVGPCSADNEDTVCEYVRKLKTVADKVSDKLMIIQISPVPQVTVTKECFISQTLIRLLTFLPELLLSARCT